MDKDNFCNFWFSDFPWFCNRKREIDENTIIDLLGLLQYECNRIAKKDDIGITEDSNSIETIFDYILDTLGISSKKEERELFYELFYGELAITSPEEFDGKNALKAIRSFQSKRKKDKLK